MMEDARFENPGERISDRFLVSRAFSPWTIRSLKRLP